MCPSLVMGSRIELGELVEYYEILRAGNKPESRCILEKKNLWRSARAYQGCWAQSDLESLESREVLGYKVRRIGREEWNPEATWVSFYLRDGRVLLKNFEQGSDGIGLKH